MRPSIGLPVLVLSILAAPFALSGCSKSQPGPEAMPPADTAQADAAAQAAEAKAAEEAKAAAKGMGIDAKAEVEQGISPADIIVRYATDKGIDRFLVGSVTAKVVSHAPCSILVLR